jgi:hypothetical protein
MWVLRLLLLASLVAPVGLVTDDTAHLDPNGYQEAGWGIDPNGITTDDGPGIDPDGAQLCYSACLDPNG